ncbi:MAG: hypothetical protein KY468_09880 [Armatimonadetes bacterium]|nr:hypothetical protein [Armatimonadota bacterium]
MKKQIFAWASFGFLSLSLTLGTGMAQAATRPTTERPAVRRATPPVQRARVSQRDRFFTVRTDASRLTTMQEWAQFVQTEIPTLDKVERDPFFVDQHRRFERGETRVPASLHIF